jgi:hypothetical protein
MNLIYLDPNEVWLPDPILMEREIVEKRNKIKTKKPEMPQQPDEASNFIKTYNNSNIDLSEISINSSRSHQMSGSKNFVTKMMKSITKH